MRRALQTTGSAATSAGRTAHPQEPMPHLERATDRWREQHRHALGLPFIPRCDEATGIF